MNSRIAKTPVIKIEVRVEPNHDGSHILWNIQASDGTKSSGFAKTAHDAMCDAAAFVEAMLQPRVGGLMRKPELRLAKYDQ
jgi:hypothetical protein